MNEVTQTPEPAPEAAVRARPRRGPVKRWTLRILGVLVAIVAALVVTGLSIDLGPSLRKRAEAEATKYLERPMHIGRLSALLRPGEFELDDIVIEGLTPDARPFLTARRLHFYVPWWGLIRKQLTVEVRMTDWTMLVETFPGGKHNMPKLVPKRDPSKPPSKPLPFTTRVNFVYADGGAFTYEDHATPWTVVAPNLNVDIAWANALASYVGTARFTGGTVQIQHYLPMTAALTARFGIDASIVRLPSIDLVTDGAHSRVRGEVDFSKWPEQRYLVDSTVDFARMKDIFFAKENWRLSGEGRFQGVFHLFKDGRELRGDFTSAEAGVDSYRFPNLRGSLAWLPHRFEVTNAEADLYGGRAKFAYSMDPIGTPEGSTSTFDVDYAGVDLATLGRAHDWKPLLVRGRATGRNALQWLTGHFHDTAHGDGESTVAPPDGAELMPPTLPDVPVIAPAEFPFDKGRSISPLAVGGHFRYRFDPQWLDFENSWAASKATYVSFHGRSAYKENANIPFHVTSADWQESDRVLVAIMSEFGASASVIEVGGRGTFDGVFTESFTNPRVAGKFSGDFVHAWDVTWGRAVADLVIQNHYVDVTNGVIGDTADRRILADGRYSLGYPRRDGGEEIHAHVRTEHWPLHDFRTAFRLTDWPIDGTASADVTLTGPYERPFGSGTLTIDDGIAWRETFDQATSTMQFVGNGLNLTRISMTKGTGLIHGVMWIGWDKTYSFDADGDHIAVESLHRFTLPQAPLSGVLKFKATGTGSFTSPTYTFDGFIADLSAGSEGVGPVLGKFTVRNNVMAIDYLEAASDRLGKVSGSGTIALNEEYDADLTLRFTDTSIDPYLKFIASVEPQLSPFFRAVASGSVRVAGELVNPAELLVDATIDDAKLTLLDYDLHNDGRLRVTFDQNVITIQQFKLAGNGTNLELHGAVPLGDSPMNLEATGDVSLAILQGLSSLKYVSSSGTANLSARLEGTAHAPVFSGFAEVQDGRVRHLSLPRSIENINGRINFDALGINVDGVRAQMGGGDIAFGGSISLKGFVPSEFNLTATGSNMRLRYPEGFETTADADLRLTGPIAAPTLSGTVDVLHTTFTRQIETDLSVLLAGGAALPAPAPVAAAGTGFPLTFEIRLQAPPIAIVDTKNYKIFGHIDSLDYTGTLDRPILAGRVWIDSGELFFGGNRYVLNSSYVDFSNMSKIEPFFNIDLETRLRASGQTYNVTLRTSGTFDHFVYSLVSDPFLPQYDILSLMLGESPDVGTAEQRALRSPQEAQAQAFRTFMAQLLTAPLSSRVGSVVEKTVGLDTVQIVPLLGNDASLQQLTPGARLTLGQRISSRAFLTYSRTLNQQQLEIITLEYDQSDRVSWVLSRNEDHTFALDFRIRHVF